ncbi:hypothetical protein [Paraburkholderia sp. 2C]|jgi:hypothetical protein
MQISDNAALSSGSTQAPSGATGRNDGPSFQDLLSQLKAYTGSPGQAMFNMILAQLGVTPEQLAQMTPEEREKIEAKIRDLMKKDMQAQQAQQQDPSTQLIQMQQQGLQASMQSDTSSSSSHKHNAIEVEL